MDHITRRRAAELRPLQNMQYNSSTTPGFVRVCNTKGRSAPSFQVSTRLSTTARQFLPGPNSTGRRSVTFIHHFHPKFNFIRVLGAGSNSRAPFPPRRALKASFFPPLLLQPSACRVLTSAGRNILPYSGHVKRE